MSSPLKIVPRPASTALKQYFRQHDISLPQDFWEDALTLLAQSMMEIEVSQFLRGVPEGRTNYYGTTYLYQIGVGGMVPWKTVGDFDDKSSERENSHPIAKKGWLGGGEMKFYPESALASAGGQYQKNPTVWHPKVVVDRELITGQNPWSVWLLAETMIRQLGYVPKKRQITAEENSINLLSIYKNKGYNEAKVMIKNNISEGKPIARELIAMHGVVAAMKMKLGTFFDLISVPNIKSQIAKREPKFVSKCTFLLL